MRNNRTYQRSSARPGRTALTVILIILIVILGAFVTLVAVGEVAVNWDGLRNRLGLNSSETRAEPARVELREGQAYAIVTRRPIQAYEALTIEHFHDREGRLFRVAVTPDSFPSPPFNDVVSMIGRVSATDIPAGRAIHDGLLMPAGTRPGVVAAVPPGKRAMVLDASLIRGVHGLNRGDRVDIIATMSIDLARQFRAATAGAHVANLGGDSEVSSFDRQVVMRVLVENGQIVQPARQRATQGAPTSSRRGPEEIIIAVDPNEVTLLNEAIALGADIMCVARSGRPDDIDTTVPTTSRLGGEHTTLNAVETIVGNDRRVIVFPGSNTNNR
ncbi:MAG: hypothetical protein EA379_04710 [Phycisphaerales bacterium]|nr:MAG: hypothetical protein EA379_04710 [Phycisphaerales bacterium]